MKKIFSMTKLLSIVMVIFVSMSNCSNTDKKARQSLPISTAETDLIRINVSGGQSSMENSITLTLKSTYKGFRSPTGIAV